MSTPKHRHQFRIIAVTTTLTAVVAALAFAAVYAARHDSQMLAACLIVFDGGIVIATSALWSTITHREPATMTTVNPMPDELAAAAAEIADAIRGWSTAQVRSHDDMHYQHRPPIAEIDEAASRAFVTLVESGRYTTWIGATRHELAGIHVGFGDVYLAVLVADLLSATDWDLLTGWWRRNDVHPPLPVPATLTRTR